MQGRLHTHARVQTNGVIMMQDGRDGVSDRDSGDGRQATGDDNVTDDRDPGTQEHRDLGKQGY